MLKINFKDYLIVIIKDDQYNLNSMDNKNNYKLVYHNDNVYQTTNYGINIYNQWEEDLLINNAVILNPGFSALLEDSFLIDNDNLIIAIGDSLYSLKLIELKLNWSVNCDPSCCFEIYKIKNGYLVHGEQEITKISINGNKDWSFSGADIFASVDGENIVKINENDIEITDFEKNYYQLDFNGKLIKDKLVYRN